MSELDALLGTDPLGAAAKKAGNNDKPTTSTSVKVGIVIAILIGLAGVGLAIATLVLQKQADERITSNTNLIATNTSDIKTNTSDIEALKPVGQLYDASAKTLTVENLDVNTIRFTHGGVDKNGMGITAIPGNIHFFADVPGKGERTITIIKYQPNEDPGSIFTGGINASFDKIIKHECKPQDFC